MSGVGKSLKNAINPKRLKRIAQAAINPWNLNAQKKVIEGTGKDMGMLFEPDNSAMERLAAAQEAANNQPSMPMPDELELQRARRRAGATSRSGRASTIMSGGSNGQGLGG